MGRRKFPVWVALPCVIDYLIIGVKLHTQTVNTSICEVLVGMSITCGLKFDDSYSEVTERSLNPFQSCRITFTDMLSASYFKKNTLLFKHHRDSLVL